MPFRQVYYCAAVTFVAVPFAGFVAAAGVDSDAVAVCAAAFGRFRSMVRSAVSRSTSFDCLFLNILALT
jgi:hypothetical protein